MPINTTLTGFDMVWAITQNAVNSQLEWLYYGDMIPNKVKIGDMNDPDGTGIEIDGIIDPPEMDFDTGEAKQARLKLLFNDGMIKYWKGHGPAATVVSERIAGWEIAFKVRLDIAQLAHEHLTSDEPGKKVIPPEILKILTQFKSSMFSVQSIFLDFQNSDLTTYDDINSHIKTKNNYLATNFGITVGGWIKGFKGKDNPFILGYPVTRKQPPNDVKSVLQPTGATLSVHAYEYPAAGAPDHRHNGLSTLNFLLVTGDRDLTREPKFLRPDAGSFHRNLVENNYIDGKGIIASEIFFQKYLWELLVKPFQEKVQSLPDYVHARDDRHPHVAINDKTGGFKPTDTGWHYGDHVQLKWHESGFNSHDRESEQNLQFDIKVSTELDADGSGGQRLTLTVNGSLYRYEWDQLNTDIPPFKSNVYVGKANASALLKWKIQLQFKAGKDGKITITKNNQKFPVVKDSGSHGAYKVADFFGDLLNFDTMADDWNTNAVSLGEIEKGIASNLTDQFGPIIDGAMTKIVMPARTQFMYKNILLNTDGDIEIDFVYKSEG